MTHITDRFFKSRWGVFNHYLYFGNDSEEYNRYVDSFDVKKLADQLEEIGAHYYFITIMQGSRFMLAPNETYNKITGYKAGEACARRDLIADLISELSKRNIDLYLYYTGDGPHNDRQAGEAMGYCDIDNPLWIMKDGSYTKNENNEVINELFLKNWTSVLEEYAVRYGNGVKGWWFDGMYDFYGYNAENLKLFTDAVKKGNPNAIISFNNGVKYESEENWGNADFITGESNNFSHIPEGRFINGAQNHKLITLGYNPFSRETHTMHAWHGKRVLCPPDFLHYYVKKSNANGAVITLDIWVDRDGSFDPEQVEVLKHIEKYNEKYAKEEKALGIPEDFFEKVAQPLHNLTSPKIRNSKM